MTLEVKVRELFPSSVQVLIDVTWETDPNTIIIIGKFHEFDRQVVRVRRGQQQLNLQGKP